MAFSLRDKLKGVVDGGSPFTVQKQVPRPASTAQAVRRPNPVVRAAKGVGNNVNDFGNAVTDRVGGGLLRGAARVGAFVAEPLPGQQRQSTEKFIQKYMEAPKDRGGVGGYSRKSVGGKSGVVTGTVIKGGVDLATLGKTGGATSKVVQNTTRVKNTGKVGSNVISKTAGGTAALTTMDLQQVGMGNPYQNTTARIPLQTAMSAAGKDTYQPGKITSKLLGSPTVMSYGAQGRAVNEATPSWAPKNDKLTSALLAAADILPAAAPFAKPITKAAVAGAKQIPTLPTRAVDRIQGNPMPNRNVTDDEIRAIARTQRLRQGWGENLSNVKPNDAYTQSVVQDRLGLPVNNFKALDDLVIARNTYNAKKAANGPLFKPLNEGGYAKNPFNKEVADGLSKEQSEFINAYANDLESMGQGNGVAITKASGNEAYGLDDFANKRVSNNYRDAELGTGNVTKEQWFDQARKELESGKGMYGASDEYKTLLTAQQAKQAAKQPVEQVAPEVSQKISGSLDNSIAPTDTAPSTKPTAPKNLDELFSSDSDLFSGTPAKPPANSFQDILRSKTRPDSIKEVVKGGGNPLYHDTTAKGILGILDSGDIRTSQAPFSQIAGQGKRVSTTRNFDNYSRYGKAPYRLVIDESKTGQRSIPDNRDEFESIFNKNVSTKAVQSLAIDTTNPALIKDMQDGTLANVIAKAKEKGMRIEPFEGKILPDDASNAEIQRLTKEMYNSQFASNTASGAATKPTAVLPNAAVPTRAGKPVVGGASGNGNTKAATLTDQESADYLKGMTKAQKEAQKGKPAIKETVSDFKEKFIDDLAPIEDRLNKAIKAGTSVNPKDHITYQLDRSRRAEGIMNAYVRDNKLDKLIQKVDSTDEFDQYLIARHAKELDVDIKTGRDSAKDAAIVKQLDAKYGAAAKELYGYNQKLLDTAVDYGLISKQSAATLKKRYPEYVPFNRIFNEDEMANLAGGVGRGDASLSSQSVVKRIKGSERAIASPLNSIIDKTRVVIEQGERNKAASMLASYKKLEGNPFNLKEISPTETIAGRPTISFLDKGVKRTFLTDKVIADAAKNMSRQDIGLWGRIAAIPARALRGGATAANVGFAGANIVKDMVGAAINSKHSVRIADPTVFGKSLAAALKHDGESYTELMREGVSGTSFDMFRNPLKSNVAEIKSYKNPATRAAYLAKHPGQIYRTFENTIGRSEDYGRALQYYSNKKGFKANGKNATDATILAADQARSNSTNFFRHGSVGKGVNLAIPYWNAGVQGARIQARRIKERPAATLSKMGVAIVAPSAMIALNNYSDETKREVMDNIPEYEKKGNIIIVGPNARYNKDTNEWDGVFKFPVPPQHIGIHNTVQDAVKASKTGADFDIAKNLGLISENYTTFNATDPREVANRYTPQAVKLIAEPTTNTNLYTGNKIVPDSQKNLPAEDQSSDYSSGTAKTLGKAFNISPRQLDNSFRTGLGGAGQNLLRGTDTALSKAGVIKPEEVRGKGLGESITGRFYGPKAINPSDKADKKFADLKKEITNSDAYKKAPAYDKSRMLNRLETDIAAVEYKQHNAKNGTGEYAPDYTGKDKKLTKKQQTLVTDGFKSDTYTNLDTKKSGGSKTEVASTITPHSQKVLNQYNKLDAATRTAKIQNEPDYEWKVAKSNLENDIASNKLSGVQKMTREKAVKKLDIGKSYSKEARELHGKSKADVFDYITKATNGQKLADELTAYDQALYAAGFAKYATFANGIAPKGRGGSRSGSKSASGRKTGKGSRGGKAGKTASFDFSAFASINRLASSNQSALRSTIQKKRITRKKVAK